MAEAKTNGFRWLPSYYIAVRDLPDKERLSLYDAIMDYGFGNTIEELPPMLNAIFSLIQPTLEKSVKFEEKQRENGEKGGRPAKPKRNPNETQIDSGLSEEKPKETQTDFGENLDVDIDIDVANDIAVAVADDVAVEPRKSAIETAFEEFWAAYPKKVGKKDAFKAFQKVHAAERHLLVPAVEMQKQSRQWQAEGGRFIPNPSTWLNQGRWLDEPQKEEPERKPAADQKPVKPNQVVASMKYNWSDMDDLLAGLDNI